jgi:hypothetical protein
VSHLPRLVVLTRLPVPGAAKTRLIPALGADGAAATHRALTEHTLRRLRPLDACGEVDLEVHVDGDSRSAAAWLGRGTRCRAQGPGDLGDRIQRAFNTAFDSGAPRSVVVGSDCPDLSHAHVRQALGLLRRTDLVLGPAEDGGYYLIGLRRSAAAALPSLLEVEWSTDHVLIDTIAAAKALGLSIALLERLCDIDTPDDLADWHRVLAEASRLPSTISVVIPALNESERVRDAIESDLASPGTEVVVADGGSTDDTCAIAADSGAQVVVAPRGRASQCNTGASAASGDIVVFLHADTVLPDGFAEDVREGLARPDVAATAFEFGTECHTVRMRFIERATSLRSRLLSMPYGDQALALRRDVFEELGGFPDLPIMEDYEFMMRVRRLGRVLILPKVATTSGRAWERHGVIRTTAVNRATIWGYRLGVPTEQLARFRARIAARSYHSS